MCCDVSLLLHVSAAFVLVRKDPLPCCARNAKVHHDDAPMYDYFLGIHFLDYFDDVHYFRSEPEVPRSNV